MLVLAVSVIDAVESNDVGPDAADDDDADDEDMTLNEAQRRRSLCHFCVIPVSAAVAGKRHT